MAVEIPRQLQKAEFRFIKIKKNDKIAVEKRWQEDGGANYQFDSFVLQKWMKEGNNYGIVAGFGNLIIIDADTKIAENLIKEYLPKTFSLRSPGHMGLHFYYICPDLKENIKLMIENGDYGQVQTKEKYVVGANCIHPNGKPYTVEDDVEIATISSKELKFALRDFLIPLRTEARRYEDELRKKDNINEIPLDKILNIGEFRNRGEEYFGSHPIHGSDTGMNFHFNPSKGVWHCFRCDSGGGFLSLIAVLEGIIECRKAIPGGLIKDKFKETLKIAEEKYGLILPDDVEKLKIIEEEISIKEIYKMLLNIYKRYIDINEKYYPFIACWIIGNYFHKHFISYPYLFLNAMKGAGKTRFLKLSTILTSGAYTVNITEAVLFRQRGPLFIDEVENLQRREKSGLRELLNVAYKEGGTVQRARKVEKTGEIIIDEFNCYRPIALANIEGLDDVLEDRCIKIILERSYNPQITRRLELFDFDEEIQRFKSSVVVSLVPSVVEEKTIRKVLEGLFNYYNNSNIITTHNNTNNLTTITTPNDTKLVDIITKKIENTALIGRDLELWLPIFIISSSIGEDVLDQMMFLAKEHSEERKITNIMENRDAIFITFLLSLKDTVSEEEFISLSTVVKKYLEENPDDKEWFDTKWVGRALIRNNIIKKKRRLGRGREVILDFEKIETKGKKLGIDIDKIQEGEALARQKTLENV